MEKAQQFGFPWSPDYLGERIGPDRDGYCWAKCTRCSRFHAWNPDRPLQQMVETCLEDQAAATLFREGIRLNPRS